MSEQHNSPESSSVTFSEPQLLTPPQEALYREVLQVVEGRGIPYAVSGAFALREYTGISRMTKDLDLFLTAEDSVRTLDYLRKEGFQCEVCDPVWLSKAHRDGYFVDLITGMSNAVLVVEPSWIEHARPATIVGINTRVLAPELPCHGSYRAGCAGARENACHVCAGPGTRRGDRCPGRSGAPGVAPGRRRHRTRRRRGHGA